MTLSVRRPFGFATALRTPCRRRQLFPFPERAEKRILIFVTEHVGHFDNRKAWVCQMLESKFMTSFTQQALESHSFISQLALQ